MLLRFLRIYLPLFVCIALIACGDDSNSAEQDATVAADANNQGDANAVDAMPPDAMPPGPPMVAFSVAASSATEVEGTLAVTIALSVAEPTTEAITVPIGVGLAATATLTTDYEVDVAEVTFPAGSEDSATQTVTLTFLTDTLVEGAETVPLQLSTPVGGAVLGALAKHVATIDDSDSASVSFETVVRTFAETATASITVSLTTTGPSGTPVLATAVTVTVSDPASGTATAGSDYEPFNGSTITFTAGAMSEETQAFGVSILPDLATESDETAILELTNPTGPLELGTNVQGSFVIADDDRLIVGSLGTSNYFFSVLDTSTTMHATSPLGIGGITDIEGTAYDSANGLVYLSQDLLDDGVAVYDVTAGTLTWLGGYALGSASVLALAFDDNTGTLYGVDDTSDTLITIDTASGLATPIGNLGSAVIRGLAFDPNANILYGYNANNARLVTIDTTLGTITTIGPLVNIYGLAFDSNTNTLYGTNSIDDTLMTIDTTTGAATEVGPMPTVFRDVHGLAFDPVNNDLFAVDLQGMEALFKLDTTATTATVVVATGVPAPNGAAHDAVAGVTYVVDQARDLVFTVDRTTGAATLIGALDDLSLSMNSLAVDPAGPTLYTHSNEKLYTISTTDASVTLIGDVFRAGTTTPVTLTGLTYNTATGTLWGCDNDELFTVDTTTAEATLVGPTGFSNLEGLADDPVNGVLYAVDDTGFQDTLLLSLNKTTGAATEIGQTGSLLLRGITYDPTTGFIYGGQAAWLKLSPNTGLATSIDAPDTNTYGMAWDTNTQTLYLSGKDTNFLYILDPVTWTTTAIGPIGVETQALAFDPSTSTLFASAGTDLLTIDTATGAPTTVGSTGVTMFGLAYDGLNDVLYGTDATSLFTINPLTGVPTLTGPHLDSALIRGLGFDFQRGVLYGVDTTNDMIVSINIATGEATPVRAAPYGILDGVTFAR